MPFPISLQQKGHPKGCPFLLAEKEGFPRHSPRATPLAGEARMADSLGKMGDVYVVGV